MKVLVVGGSGFIGREFLRQLVAAGHSARVLARGTRPTLPGVESVRGSVLDPASLRGACDGCDVVVYLAGIIAETREQTYERVHDEGVGHVLAEARAAGVRRWVHMSALGTRADAVSRYHRSKWAGEQRVRASGLGWAILRPSLVYGPGDGLVNLFAGMARWSPVLPLLGGGGAELQPIGVGEVARCFVAAVEGTGTGRETTLCGHDRVTLRRLVELVLEATGRRRLLVTVPWGVARVQARLCEWFFTGLLGKAPPLNRDQLVMLAEGNTGDPSAMFREFGVDPRPLREGIGAMFRG